MVKTKIRLLLAGFAFLLFYPASYLKAQPEEITLDRAVEIALQNNPEYNALKLKVEQNKALIPSAYSIDKTQFFYGYDQNNMAENEHPLNIAGVEQSFSFPTLYTAQRKVNMKSVSLSESELEIGKLNLIKEVSKAYYQIGYLKRREVYYSKLDTLYSSLTSEVESHYKSGGATNLDLLNAKARHQQVHLSLVNLRYDMSLAYRKLYTLLNCDTFVNVVEFQPTELPLMTYDIDSNPGVALKKTETQANEAMLKVEKNRLLPDLSLSFYNGTNRFNNSKNYLGYQVGISLPLFFAEQKSKINAGKIAVAVSRQQELDFYSKLKLKKEELLSEIRKLRKSLDYFATTGKSLSNEIVNTARESYASQEIDLYQYVQSIENSTTIELEYLDWLAKYNEVVLELNYLTL